MMDWLSVWWVWVSAALVLGLVELLAPGFIFLGFALSALTMAALAGLDMLPASVPAVIAIFAILALIDWIALRRAFRGPSRAKTFDHDIND